MTNALEDLAKFIKPFVQHSHQTRADIQRTKQELAAAKNENARLKAQVKLYKLRSLERGLKRAIAAETARSNAVDVGAN